MTPVSRLRLAATCLLLTLVAFVQEPGRIVPDTKLDLTVNPGAMMGRALHLWDPLGFAGQVQNQGYGYLWPMAPFFWLGEHAGVPVWVVQRVWWALLLVLACTGVVALLNRLGIGVPWSRLLAGVAYALAPRMLTTLGPISAEALPMALAPWVLVPLVTGSLRGSTRRAAGLSGLAVLCVGGVNAVASATVLVLPALWLATRPRGARRRGLSLWWVLAVCLATLWWAAPLLVLGRVSPPFLDFIESATTTTLPGSLVEVLRGTDHWVAFVLGPDGPTWRAGWALITIGVVVVYTGLVAATGLVGLTLRSLPHRTWLRSGFAVGLLMITFGHTGPAAGLFAGPQQSLLDGVLAPLRNIHKYDPVLRLVLVIGIAHALAMLPMLAVRRADFRPVVPAVAALVVLAVAGAAWPAWQANIAPRGSYLTLPDYWDQASRYVAERDPQGRSLVLPGASFARFTWGVTRDEPFQAYGRSPWVVRDAIPLTPPATIRMLDAVQRRVAAGLPSPGLGAALAGAGVHYVVVRNDVDTAGRLATLPSLVHETLAGAAGIDLVASFGPYVGGQIDDTTVVDRGLSVPYRAVEVYEVQAAREPVELVALQQVPRVVGGPEDLAAGRDAGLLGAGPAVLAGDAVPAQGPLIQADGIARRELNPGQVDDNVSARLTQTDPLTLDRKVRDYPAFPDDRADAPATWTGTVQADASSQGSDADTPGGPVPVHQAAAAIDGDGTTSWRSDPTFGAVGAWLQVRTDTPRDFSVATLRVDTDTPGPRVTRVRVSTDTESVLRDVPANGRVTLRAPPEPSRTLRITADAVLGSGRGVVFGVSEVSVLGLDPSTTGRGSIAPRADAKPRATVVTAAVNSRPTCVHPGDTAFCTDLLARAGEEAAGLDRTVDLGGPGTRQVRVTAAARPGTWLTDVVSQADDGFTVSATSALLGGPATGPRAALDLDLSTAWLARADDRTPTLTIDLGQPRTVTGLRLTQQLGLAASRPVSVSVRDRAGTLRAGRFDQRGYLRFDPLRTDRLTVRFTTVQPVISVDPSVGGGELSPVGVSDLRIIGAGDSQPDNAGSVELPCGSGPVIRAGGQTVQTRVTARRAELIRGEPVTAQPCGLLTAAAGPQRLTVDGAGRWDVRWATVTDPGTLARPTWSAPALPGVERPTWDATHREVTVPPRAVDALLVVRENINPGWQARLGATLLSPVRVEGWAQGWLVPAGAAGTVRLDYTPDGAYRWGLLVGLLAALALVGLAWARPVSRRRLGPILAPARAASAGPDARATAVNAHGSRPGNPWLAQVLIVATLLLLGGWVGGLLGLVALAAVRYVPWRGWPVVVAPTAYLGAVVLLAAAPWGSGDGYAGGRALPQILSLIAVAAVLVVGLRPGRSRPSGSASGTTSATTTGAETLSAPTASR